jgi:flagellin-like hook-associated protein FlgL
MAAISTVPSGRLSDLYIYQQLTSQLQANQVSLAKLQTQISTGRRISLPSEDTSAALRAISIQDMLAQTDQINTNISATQSYLNASTAALSNVSTIVANVQATALGAVGTTANASQRATAAQSIQQSLTQLLSIANQTFQGRSLFAGSKTTTTPFQLVGNTVIYNGDDKSISNYIDLNALFASNVTGDQAFGAYSTPPAPSANLNPTLTDDTPLANLRGGQGIRPGTIIISDGFQQSKVDITGASTIGDVARLLEANPPPGRTVTARVTSTGLSVQLDAAGGGNLLITESGDGTTAAELGIKHTSLTGTGPMIGADLDPVLTPTTTLNNILGTRAQAVVTPTAAKTGFIVEANSPGAAYNGVQVNLVDSTKLQAGPGLPAGQETAIYNTVATAAQASLALPGPSNDLILTANAPGSAYNGVSVNIVNGGNIGDAATASYNAGTKTLTLSVDGSNQTSIDTLITAINSSTPFTATRDTSAEANTSGGVVLSSFIGANRANTYNSGADANTLTVDIHSGVTTTNQVIAAINKTGQFTARIDPSQAANDGGGVVLDSYSDPAATGTTSGGSGQVFDTSGLQIVNGGKTYNIDFSGARTIEDVLNVLNSSPAGVEAEINAAGNGIDIRSRVSGSDFSIGENGGTTATQLGVRTLTPSTQLSDLNYGNGMQPSGSTDLIIHSKSGAEFGINLSAGVVASARLNSAGANNALLISAAQPGTAGNTFSVQITDSGAGGPSSVSLVGNVLTFSADLSAGLSAQQAISLLQANPSLSSQFTAQLDLSSDAGNDGTGNLAATGPVALAGGAGAASTIGDVINLINNNPSNLASGVPVVAQLASMGNGIQLVQSNTAGTDALAVKAGTNTAVAIGLGFLNSSGQTTSSVPGSTSETLTAADTNPGQVSGLFTALLRLSTAITNNDDAGVQQGLALLNSANNQLATTQAETGLRLQGLDSIQQQLQTQQTGLKGNLSDDLDTDMAATISQLLGQQTAFQAALQVAGTISKLTLLNYL